MKKLTALLMLVLCSLLILASCQTSTTVGDTTGGTQQDTDTADTNGGEQMQTATELNIHKITDFNIESETDSHKDEWESSQLELSMRERYIFDTSVSKTTELWYPRIKKTASDEYILLYMNGDVGHDIYISYSKDLKRWYGTEKLFAYSKEKQRMYASADAIVLKNGDIIAAAGYRWDYRGDSLTNGIEIRRSTDNGKTWSEPEIIYTGAVWEPSLLQLESGELQIYWTNTHVQGASVENGGRTDDNSTGTAMLRSFDNGYTWNNDITVPYTAQIVAQQYTKTGTDGNYYNGQMPVATQLNNGDIVLALEVRCLDSAGKKTYNLSFAYSSGENSWPDALGADEEGPASLIKNMYLKGAGPYIRQFKSGETLLSYHWGIDWFTLIGNSTATQFKDRVEAFGKDADMYIWGSTEITGTHSVICTAPSSNKQAIYIGNFYLNHTIEAEKAQITVDGKSDDWNDVDQAFFVGSESQAQASIRVSQDDDSIYMIAEVLDNFISDKDRVAFAVGNQKTGKYINVSVFADGGIAINKGSLDITKEQIEAAVLVDGTIDDYSDKDNGYVIELKLPKSVFGDTDTLIFDPILYNKDSANGKAESDSIGDISISDTSTWLKIKLK